MSASRPYSREFVARCKAMFVLGVTPKRLSKLTGVPYWTLSNWKRGSAFKDIPPDSETVDRIKGLIAPG